MESGCSGSISNRVLNASSNKNCLMMCKTTAMAQLGCGTLPKCCLFFLILGEIFLTVLSFESDVMKS